MSSVKDKSKEMEALNKGKNKKRKVLLSVYAMYVYYMLIKNFKIGF